MKTSSWQMRGPPPNLQAPNQGPSHSQPQADGSFSTSQGGYHPTQQYDDRTDSTRHTRAPGPPLPHHASPGQFNHTARAPPNYGPPLPPGPRPSAPVPAFSVASSKPGGGQSFPPFNPPPFPPFPPMPQQFEGSGLTPNLMLPPPGFPQSHRQQQPTLEGRGGAGGLPSHMTRFSSPAPPHSVEPPRGWSTTPTFNVSRHKHWNQQQPDDCPSQVPHSNHGFKSQSPSDHHVPPPQWRDRQSKSNFKPSRIQPYQSHRQPTSNAKDLSMFVGRTAMTPQDCVSDMPYSISKPERAETEDQKWVKNWLQGIKNKQTPAKETRKQFVKLSDARRMLTTFLQLLDQLKEKKQEATDCSMKEADETRWTQLCREMEQLSSELKKVETAISNPEFVESLKVQVEKRRKKRERKRRCRQEEWEMREEEFKRRNEKIDASMAAALHAKQEKEQEEILAKEVDGVLSEVRKKKHDANKTMELLRALRKLRHLRKESAKKNGNVVPGELDIRFEQKVLSLEEMMNKQKLLYVEEERTLQVMLEEEHEETREKARQKKELMEQQKAQQQWQQQLELLFGKTEELELGDPLFIFRQFHQQAEHNLQSLVNIRRLWDAFISPEIDLAASSIPVSWVMPSEPANHIWATALEGSPGS